MLYNGERVGDGTGPEVDVAVDPIDGTTLTGKGQDNALSVLAVADRGAMYDPSAVFYMDKLACGPEGIGVVDIGAAGRGQHPRAGQGQGRGPRGPDRRRPRPAAPRGAGRRHPGQRRPDQVHLGRRRRRRDHGRPAGHRHRPDGRRGRYAGGHHRGLRHQVPGRRAAGPALAARRRRAAQGPGRRPRPGPGPRASTTWSSATRSSSRPASPTASCCAGVRYFPGGAATSSLVMRSRSGTIRRIEATHLQRKVEELSGEERTG